LYLVAVLEPSSGEVTSLIRDWLLRRGNGPSVVLTRGEALHSFSGKYDLFVAVSGDGEVIESAKAQNLCCRVLLTPGGRCRALSEIPSQWVVSYGLAVRDSLTVSSLEPKQAVLALQRELVTLEGTVLERQELPLPIPPETGAEGLMALYGSLLILGVPPEELSLV